MQGAGGGEWELDLVCKMRKLKINYLKNTNGDAIDSYAGGKTLRRVQQLLLKTV